MKSSWRTGVVIFVPVAICFLYFRYIVPYHICLKEQIQLFVFSSSYVFSYFSKPAAIACLGGDFLTQFFYFKTGGAVVVTLLLATEWWLIFLILKRFFVETWRAASLPAHTHIETLRAASLLPVMAEWIAWPHHSFSAALSVSFIIALTAFLVYVKANGKTAITAGVLLIPALYAIAGASVFLFLFLVVLYDFHCGKKRFIYRTLILCLSIATPVLFRHSYLLTLRQAYFYPFINVQQGLSLMILLAVILGGSIINVFQQRGVCWVKRRIPRWLPPLAAWLCAGLFLAAGLVKTTDPKQENLFGIVIEAYHENWDKIIEIAERTDLKNPITTNYINLALSHKDLLGERLMDFYQHFSTGLLLPAVPSSDWLTLFSGNDAYYHIGDMDIAQHAAMVGMIALPRQRSARLAERLAEINMALDDLPAATKYIRILESTLFHRTTSKTSNSAHRKAVVFREDVIRKAVDIKSSLELLVESDPDNLPAVNYLLCLYLLHKDIPAFFKAYTSYCKGKYRPVPKVYAEALLVYFAGMKSTMREVNEYGIHPDMIKAFGDYTRMYEASDGNLTPMQKNFPNTYWLYFHFAVMNNEQLKMNN